MRSKYIVQDILKEITQTLNPHIERAPREAQLLLMAHLDVDEIWLMMNRNAEVRDVDKLFEWVDRRVKNEPFEYITNSVSFYSQEFYIAEGALIPRPETELLIDEVIKRVKNKKFKKNIKNNRKKEKMAEKNGKVQIWVKKRDFSL